MGEDGMGLDWMGIFGTYISKFLVKLLLYLAAKRALLYCAPKLTDYVLPEEVVLRQDVLHPFII